MARERIWGSRQGKDSNIGARISSSGSWKTEVVIFAAGKNWWTSLVVDVWLKICRRRVWRDGKRRHLDKVRQDNWATLYIRGETDNPPFIKNMLCCLLIYNC